MNGLVGRAQNELHQHGDLAALYEELAKLHHPACPDVDWRKVEQWCRELLRDNGSDLQIAAFLALALAQRYGLPGVAEGMTLLNQLLAGAWDRLWPRNATERMDILAWLFTQWQPSLRGLDIGKRDASLIRTLEADLACLQEVLGRQRLPAMTALRALNQQVSALAARLQDDASPLPGHPRERGSAAPEQPMRLFISMPEHGGVAPVVYLERRPGKRALRVALVLLLGLVALVPLGVLGWQHWQRMQEQARIATEPIRLDSLQLFDSGSARLKPDSTKVLINALANVRAQPGWLIVITGHTDATGDELRNLALAQARAAAVRDWMKNMGDVADDCFAVRGQGSGQPIADNATEAGRAANRRVDISLLPEPGACQAPR